MKQPIKFFALLFTTAAFFAPHPAQGDETYVIRGPGQVVNGWVGSSGQESFESSELQGSGVAWGTYHRCLTRFDLTSIDPSRFGRVAKATLRFHVRKVNNPSAIETLIQPLTVPWSVGAAWTSPDGAATWPTDKNRQANIDYAGNAERGVAITIEKPGPLDIDITSLVNAWLFEGLDNHGLLVRTGSTIFGNPDAGTWTFGASEADGNEGPELVVEMTGAPPQPDDMEEQALALYPSPLLPPVNNPVIIVWFNLHHEETYRRVPSTTMATYSRLGDRLLRRGVINLGWAEGGPAGWLPSREAWEQYYVRIAGRSIGYCMHEWHMSSDTPDAEWAVAAVRAAKKEHPACYSAFFYQSQESMAGLAAEGYTHVTSQFPIENFAIGMDGIKRRIDVAREAGSIDKLVVMLGHIAEFKNYHQSVEVTADLLESQIKELRGYAPEMPGIGFYYSGGLELAAAADALARKYFMDPAPDVHIVEPRFQAALNTPHVRVRVEAAAKEDREVVRYRWFIDNRLVAETDEPQYLWDIRAEPPATIS